MNTALVILVVLSSLSLNCDRPRYQGESAKRELDSRIPPDDPAKYRSVRDAEDWLNPYLVIRKEGVAVRCLAISKRDWQIISPEDLRKTLVELPVKAWPYGRVVAVQEIGIRSGDDDQYIAPNKAKTEKVLESLGLNANWWPSA